MEPRSKSGPKMMMAIKVATAVLESSLARKTLAAFQNMAILVIPKWHQKLAIVGVALGTLFFSDILKTTARVFVLIFFLQIH